MKLFIYLFVTCLLAIQSAWSQPQPTAKAVGTMIRISGVVDEMPKPNAFELNYGDGEIVVEFDDWDPEPDAYKLKKGDEVVVTGRLDDDFLHGKTLEAGSVYVKDIEETYYANPRDEEAAFANMSKDMEELSTVVQGTVVSVNGKEFVLKSDTQEIKIDVSAIADTVDSSDIKPGDTVRVAGKLQRSFFKERKIQAIAVIRKP